MSEVLDFDLVIKNVRVVRPNHNSIAPLDLGIKNGKFARIAPEINPSLANEILYQFPCIIAILGRYFSY